MIKALSGSEVKCTNAAGAIGQTKHVWVIPWNEREIFAFADINDCIFGANEYHRRQLK